MAEYEITGAERITELPEASDYSDDMFYMVDSATGGSKKIPITKPTPELKDIRTGVNQNYQTAGDAVRGQIDWLRNGGIFSKGWALWNDLPQTTETETIDIMLLSQWDYDEQQYITKKILAKNVYRPYVDGRLSEIDDAIAYGYYWNENRTYKYGEIVIDSNALYKCKVETSQGREPVLYASDWFKVNLLSMVFDENARTATSLQLATPSSARAYEKGDLVYHATSSTSSSKLYMALKDFPHGVESFVTSEWLLLEDRDSISNLSRYLNKNIDELKETNERNQYEIEAGMIKGNVNNLPLDVATFDDGAENVDIKNLSISIEAIQSGSGDPSPTNIRPISGWDECNVTVCGKNLFDNTKYASGTWITGDGTIEPQYGYRTSDWISVKQGDVIRRSETGTARGGLYDKNKNPISYAGGTTITVTQDGYYRFCITSSYYSNDIMCVRNNTDLTFEPYNGSTYTIQLTDGSNPIVVYEGVLDVLSGLLTVYRGKVNAKDLTYGAGVSTGGQHWADINGSSVDFDPISDKMRFNSNSTIGWNTSHPNMTVSSDKVRVYGSTEAFGTGGDYENAIVVYRLATPITYQLTPTEVKTLLEVNNIFADCGEVLDCKYVKDATIVINNILERINS